MHNICRILEAGGVAFRLALPNGELLLHNLNSIAVFLDVTTVVIALNYNFPIPVLLNTLKME